ncbi:MAG: carboxypeptidase regulatory-like domain-containing protein [Candidatus Baltobacteraceae bacterium]
MMITHPPCASFLRFVRYLSVTAVLLFGLLSARTLPALAAGGQIGSLSGTVVDASTRAPLANATVAAVAPTGNYHTKTDGAGHFSIVGMIVDTYVVSVQAEGYDPITLPGVTVQGDQTVSLGSINASKHLQTIGRVSARSASSVFQPSQTVDTYAVTGNRILQTTGKAASTSENNLALAVPGVSLSSSNSLTIRGGLRTEVGYQLDGVNFTEPFFSNNASNSRFNGLGTLQVVEGAGDATQGNVGGGVVNLIPKRGTNPGFGYLDFETGGPNYFHQFAFEYGIATPNGRFSDYIAYNGQRDVPYTGYPMANAAAYDNYYSTSYQKNDDFLNNFVYKFGKNNAQSFQVLYLARDLQDYGLLGGTTGANFYPNDPFNSLVAGFISPLEGLGALPAGSTAAYPHLVGLNPGTPHTSPYAVHDAELTSYNPTNYLKLEYDNNFNATTFLQARFYNWQTMQGGCNNQGSTGQNVNSLGLGSYPACNATGGPRVGGTVDLTKQIGTKNTVTLEGNYETAHPRWENYDPNAMVFLLALNSANGAPGATYGDFLPGGYLSKFFGSNIPRIPNSGINYNGAWFQQYGVGIRDQFAPTDKLKFDLGLREDFQKQNYGLNPFNTFDPSNPSDVNPPEISATYLNPHELQPRAAVSYEMTRDDSFRFGYGRSVIFLNAQTSGTPAFLYNYQPFMNIPATDTIANPLCGSGKNLTVPGPSHLWKCQNYAQQLYWLYDQNFDAPDLGGALPAVYNNYDFTYQHQFKNGLGLRLTPFYRFGTNIPSFALVTGLAAGAAVFTANNKGISRTTGVEFGLTTPDHPVGFSGFLSATYQNVLGSTPPLIGGEDSLPINGSGSLNIGDVYRAGYVSPFSVRVGGEYKTRNGFRFVPVLQYDRGYPFNVGDTIASSAAIGPNGTFVNIPQVNFGAGTTGVPGYQANGGSNSSTNYFDPAYSGSPFHPNIEGTRGTASTPSSGGALWKANLEADLTVEFKHQRNTVGVQFTNLFGNSYNGVIPTLNPYYQPVANGLSGPQTGVNPFYNPSRGFANIPKDAYAYTNGAYLLLPNKPMTFTLYYQLGL